MAGIDFSDPKGSASYLVQFMTQGRQSFLNMQMALFKTTADALTSLQSAMQSFESALNALVSGGNGVIQQTGTFSDPTIGTATVSGSAQPGTYQFFVEQLATANQQAFGGTNGMPSVDPNTAGSFSVSLGDGTTIDVDLSQADKDGDGQVSPAEIARAINQDPAASGKLNASVITVDGKQQLVITAANTGADSQITVDASNVNDPALKAALGDGKVLVAAQDAVIWLGDKTTGTRITQASNTFTGIDGVSMKFTRAMADGESPATLTIASDADATADALQKFVDAYNSLKDTLNTLTFSGDPANGKAAGPLYGDSGMTALVNKINELMRQPAGGTSLLAIGISADKEGRLSLDRDKLAKAIDKDPNALNQLFGDAKTGFVGAMESYLDTWLDAGNGQLKSRQDTVEKQQKQTNKNLSALAALQESMYQKYVKQFTAVQALQAQMANTMSILDSLDTASSKK
ncbi:flagellar filament capping protein FliD [Trinickia mobilis]|uniref:flagellar filament capping protein FliD n=1 Tax=Trinickia mobilis TaxID=2816356 RepID=UPI001A904BC5|nr:flagellar filament capping protein FliD [Trinickia mobilis]